MLQHILSALDDAVLAYNMVEGRYVYISPAVKYVFGYTEEDFRHNKNLLEEITIDSDRSSLEEETRGITKSGENVFKYRIRTKTGEERCIQEKRVDIIDDDTNHKIRVYIARDISDLVFYKKHSEERMWFMSSLINAIGAFVFRVDTEGHYTFVNDAYVNKFHYTKEQLIGKPMSVVAYPPDVDKAYHELSEAIAHPDQVRHFKHRKLTAEGDVRYVLTDGIAVRDKDGKVVEVQGVGLDITEQEKAKQELITARKNIETVINNTGDLIWSINTKKEYVFVNTAFCQWIKNVYGVEPREGMAANDREVYPNAVANNWDYYYNNVLKGQTFLVNYEETDPVTKKRIFFEISLNPIYVDKEIIGVSCFAHDVTERLKTERSITQQNERLRNIAMITSHELRKPVASLMGLMDILDKTDLTNPDNADVFKHIEITAHEVDAVVRHIVNSTFSE